MITCPRHRLVLSVIPSEALNPRHHLVENIDSIQVSIAVVAAARDYLSLTSAGMSRGISKSQGVVCQIPWRHARLATHDVVVLTQNNHNWRCVGPKHR